MANSTWSRLTSSENRNKTEKRKRQLGWGDDDDGWGGYGNYMAAKHQKLSDQFHKDSKGRHSNIFSDVVIYVNGFTNPSSDELRRLMQEHGGRYEMYLKKSVITHVIASNLPNSKFKLARSMPVVKPEWIIDSVKAGRRLSHAPYLLLGNQSQIQPGLTKFSYTSPLKVATSMESPQKISDLHLRKNLFETASSRNTDDLSKHEKTNIISGDVNTASVDQRKPTEIVKEKTKSLENVIIFSPVSSTIAATASRDKPTDLIVNDKKEESDIEIISDSEEDKEDTISLTSLKDKVKGRKSFHVFNLGKKKQINSSLKPYDKDVVISDKVTVKGLILSKSTSGENVQTAATGSVTDSRVTPVTTNTSIASIETVLSTMSADTSTKSSIPKVGDKNFLNDFYSHSRLHHISKWGAELKAYVSQIQQLENVTFPGRDQLLQAHVDGMVKLGLSETLTSSRHSVSDRTIMHIDMDSFFVSVGLLTRPELKGHPVAVTHSRGKGAQLSGDANLEWEKTQWKKRNDKPLKAHPIITAMNNYDNGNVKESISTNISDSKQTKSFYSMAEIASCSYEARKAGVKNGMFMGQAVRLCPDLKTIPYDFEAYHVISKTLYDLVASYTHDIEAVSCDEMFIDATDILTDTGATAMELATVLRSEMMDKTGCPSSVGIGPNILLARLATRKAKPNGQYQVQAKEAQEFIKEFSVRDLPGVGYSLANKLAKLGVSTCSQLQEVSVHTLRREFGSKMGELIHQYSLGQDIREVRSNRQRKSVSAEVNYGIRFGKEFELVNFFQELSNEVKKRMDAIKVKGRCITLKLMVRRPDAPVETAKFMGHGVCNTLTKSSNLPVPTNDASVIAREVLTMYRAQKVLVSDIRGIGIQINKLENEEYLKGHNIKQGQKQSLLSFTTVSNKSLSGSSSSSTTDLPKKELTANKNTSESNQTVHSICREQNKFVSERREMAASSSISYARCKAGPSSRIETSDNIYLLSESQIDNDVLQELPADIAEEVLKDVRQNKKLKASPVRTIDDVIPTESQVDPSCLSALPLSLQNELKEYYAEKKKNLAPKKQQVTPVKNAPFNGLIKGPKKGPSVLKQKDKKDPSLGKKQLKTKVKGSECVSVSNEQKSSNSDVSNVQSRSETIDEPEAIEELDISLCNVRELDDVRRLLKEWWESSSEPQREDMDIVTEYFMKLVQFNQLDQAYYLFRFIYRRIVAMKYLKWQVCMQQLVSSVQEVVRVQYGAPFKL